MYQNYGCQNLQKYYNRFKEEDNCGCSKSLEPQCKGHEVHSFRDQATALHHTKEINNTVSIFDYLHEAENYTLESCGSRSMIAVYLGPSIAQ